MSNDNAEIKKEIDAVLAEPRAKRKVVLSEYKEKIRDVKIEKIKSSILSK